MRGTEDYTLTLLSFTALCSRAIYIQVLPLVENANSFLRSERSQTDTSLLSQRKTYLPVKTHKPCLVVIQIQVIAHI